MDVDRAAPAPVRRGSPAAQGGARAHPLNAWPLAGRGAGAQGDNAALSNWDAGGAGIQPASARFLRASLSSRKLVLELAMVLREKGASRPRKLSLWTSRVPPLREVSAKLCSPPMIPGRPADHRSSTPGSATTIVGLTVIMRPLAGWTLRSVILWPTAISPDASRNSGFHSG